MVETRLTVAAASVDKLVLRLEQVERSWQRLMGAMVALQFIGGTTGVIFGAVITYLAAGRH